MSIETDPPQRATAPAGQASMQREQPEGHSAPSMAGIPE